jgi:hypothetical protein
MVGILINKGVPRSFFYRMQPLKVLNKIFIFNLIKFI